MGIRRRIKNLWVGRERQQPTPPTPRTPVPIILTPEPDHIYNNQLLAGKNALVTGAGPKIGSGIVVELARQGANVYFTEIERENIDLLNGRLREFPGKHKGFFSDITKESDRQNLWDTLSSGAIDIDILVNNVGVTAPGDLAVTSEWRRIFETNVFGPLGLTRRVSEKMIASKSGGSIIFVTSIHQWVVGRWPAYSASKGALGMIIKELAVELAPHAIRVNGIAPGRVAFDPQDRPLYDKYTPLHHSSIPSKYVGRAAVYLAADYFSQHTTGTVLKIDGGLSLFNHRVDMVPPNQADETEV